MKRTRISDILIVLGLVIFFGVHQKSLAAVGDSTIFIQNPKMVVGIGLKGGQLVDVHLKSNPVNPLTWQMAKDQMRRFTHEDAQYKGHFLCIGNIGNPSVPEIFQGLVMRGEQTGKIWSFVRENDRTLVMGSSSPSDGIEISRKLKMHESESRFLVVESFTNTTGQRRATNILQHATIGPPFLNENTLINTNAGKGFSSKYEHPDPYAYEYVFPYAVMDTISSDTVDLRIASPALNYVSKHIFDPEEDYGWVTAYDPHTGVLLGYVWRVDHYPWLNLWNASRENRPTAKGLEFGTTGLKGPFDQLQEDSISFYGHYSWEILEAGESLERSYLVFITDIGKGQRNPSLKLKGKRILVMGENGSVYTSIINSFGKDQDLITGVGSFAE